MIKIDQIKYIRPNYDVVEEKLNVLITRLENVQTYEKYLSIFKEIIKIQNHIEEMYDYADIRNMRDSKDEYFEHEIIFWNEYKPKFDLLFKPFYRLCINSNFKEQLKEIVAENFFSTIELQERITSDNIIELQKIDSNLYKFYIEMLENGYIDLETNENKVNFAITNYLTESAMPVITGNFKNSFLDVQTV